MSDTDCKLMVDKRCCGMWLYKYVTNARTLLEPASKSLKEAAGILEGTMSPLKHLRPQRIVLFGPVPPQIALPSTKEHKEEIPIGPITFTDASSFAEIEPAV